MLIHKITADANGFSHCESGGNSADAKPLDMTERKERQRSRNNKTAYVESYLDLWIAYFSYLGKFPREKVGRSYRQTAAVRERYPDADKNIAHDEPNDAPAKTARENVYPSFVQVKQLAENKSDNEAEKIGRNNLFPHYHKAENEQTLENISPRSERELRKNLRKGVRNA